MKKLICALSILFCLSLHAEDELLIKEVDSDTGINEADHDTRFDENRFSFAYHMNSDLAQARNLSTWEFNYAKRKSRAWLQFLFAKTTAHFGQLSSRNSNFPPADETLDTSIDFVNTLGLGLGFRSRVIQELLSTENLFDIISVYATYNTLSENYYGQAFKGPGMRSDFGIYKRLSHVYQMGLKFSYNLALLQRDATFDEERASQRSLTLSWTSFSLEIGIYF